MKSSFAFDTKQKFGKVEFFGLAGESAKIDLAA
jgi:hypothetical protein